VAIIKLGTTVVGIRGTLGGGVYSANKAGPYVKAWRYPIVPRTAGQLAARARAASIPDLWQSLTDAQRDTWVDRAAEAQFERTNSLGETYALTAFQLFSSWSIRRLISGRSASTSAPNVNKPSPPADVSCEADESGGFLRTTVTTGDYELPFNAWWEAQPIRSIALTAFPNAWRLLGLTLMTGPESDTWTTEYTNFYGPFLEGQAIAVRLRRWDVNGPISEPLTAKCEVAA